MSKLSPGEVESLSQLRKISGTGGFKHLAVSTDHTGLSAYAVVCQEDCVFTTFSVNGENKLDEYNLTGATIKAGIYLPVQEGSSITAITTSTGSCIAYMN
jgi:hypothetical protein